MLKTRHSVSGHLLYFIVSHFKSFPEKGHFYPHFLSRKQTPNKSYSGELWNWIWVHTRVYLDPPEMSCNELSKMCYTHTSTDLEFKTVALSMTLRDRLTSTQNCVLQKNLKYIQSTSKIQTCSVFRSPTFGPVPDVQLPKTVQIETATIGPKSWTILYIIS